LVPVLHRPAWRPAQLFYIMLTGYAFFRMDHIVWDAPVAMKLFQTAYLICFFMVPAVFAHFFALFPRPAFFFQGPPRRLLIIYGPPVTLCIPALAANWVWGADPATARIVSGLILVQGILIWAVYLINGSLMAIRGFMRIRSRILSRRFLLVGVSTILAFIPFVIRGILDTFNQPFPVSNTLLIETSLILPALALAFALDYGEDRRDGLPWWIGRDSRTGNGTNGPTRRMHDETEP
nr:hypothetical protein [bacterium]